MERSLISELRYKLNLNALPKPAIIGITGIIIVAICYFVGSFIARPSQSRVIVDSSISTALASEAEGESACPARIFIHVSGAVVNPGLVELETDSRVAAAIEAAGGFAPEADTSSVNLARTLTDGEQLFIARTNAFDASEEGVEGSNPASGSVSIEAQNNGQSASSLSKKVNINTATVSQLTALPGIGDSTASKIINERTNNGPFKKIEDITRVSGIGDKKFEALRDLICV